MPGTDPVPHKCLGGCLELIRERVEGSVHDSDIEHVVQVHDVRILLSDGVVVRILQSQARLFRCHWQAGHQAPWPRHHDTVVRNHGSHRPGQVMAPVRALPGEKKAQTAGCLGQGPVSTVCKTHAREQHRQHGYRCDGMHTATACLEGAGVRRDHTGGTLEESRGPQNLDGYLC